MSALRRGGKARPTRRVALAPPPAALASGPGPPPHRARRRDRGVRRGGRRADQTRRGGRQGAGARKRGSPRRPPVRPRSGVGRAGGGGLHRGRQPYTVRLSATDISALASMKNVAKCGTWCELQNPANHRVFERKLRPRPSGRGHACLGVTPSDAPPPRVSSPEVHPDANAGPPRPPRRGGPKSGPPTGPDTADGGRPRDPAAVPPDPGGGGPPSHRPHPPGACRAPATGRGRRGPRIVRPQVRRGHPPSLSISISGGEETYEDSPSNGERTGRCPA